MSEKTLKLYRISAVITAVLAVAAAIILSLSYSDYDETLGHIKVGAVMPIIGFAVAACAVVPAIAASVIAAFSADAKLKLHESKQTTKSLLYPRFITAAFLLAFFIVFAMGAVKATLGVFEIFAAVFALCSAFAFLLRGFAPKNGKVVAVVSLFPIIFVISSLLDVYFDESLALNSPLKSSIIVAYLYIMLLFVEEARFANRKQKTPFFVFASLAAMSGISIVIPLFVIALGKIGGEAISSYPLISALLLTVLEIFAVIRVIDTAFGRLIPHDPVKAIEVMEEEAAEDAASIDE